MKKQLLIIIFLVFVLANCSKEDDFIKMSINETSCANEWDIFYTGSNDYTDAVIEYLEKENIIVYSVTRKVYDNGPFCDACNCSTGRIIIIKINPSDLSKTETLGFSLVN
jgi:hypothetical protein